MNKCTFPGGATIRPDGLNELDPCIYKTVEIWHNATVIVSRCVKCGHVEITWIKQDNTEGGAIDGE